VLAGKTYAAATHAPILIFPNPLNPRKYVVLNSGFTFREADYLSNARQTPKLPDYAIVDITVPPDARFPGKIVQAVSSTKTGRCSAAGVPACPGFGRDIGRRPAGPVPSAHCAH
jgi:hypothetical protein